MNDRDVPSASELEAWKKVLFEKAQGTFWDYLGCEVISAEPGRVVLKLEAKTHHLNPIGIVHGGVLSSMLDNAMGLAAMLTRPGNSTVTSNLNVHFVAPLHIGELICTAELLHETKKTLTCTGQIAGDGGKLGTIATATFRITGNG